MDNLRKIGNLHPYSAGLIQKNLHPKRAIDPN
jgi:hypothetical protein